MKIKFEGLDKKRVFTINPIYYKKTFPAYSKHLNIAIHLQSLGLFVNLKIK